MKLLTEYLERAVQLEELAANEPNMKFGAELLKQAKGLSHDGGRARQTTWPSSAKPA